MADTKYAGTRYRRGKDVAADMAVYMRQISEMNTNAAKLGRLKRNLIRALNEDITPKQRECLMLYYGEGLNMRQIGERLGIDKSTVSRTVKRGEERLRRILRYGGAEFLGAGREGVEP